MHPMHPLPGRADLTKRWLTRVGLAKSGLGPSIATIEDPLLAWARPSRDGTASCVSGGHRRQEPRFRKRRAPHGTSAQRTMLSRPSPVPARGLRCSVLGRTVGTLARRHAGARERRHADVVQWRHERQVGAQSAQTRALAQVHVWRPRLRACLHPRKILISCLEHPNDVSHSVSPHYHLLSLAPIS